MTFPASDPQGYYAILGLDPDAKNNMATVKKAYHEQARRAHPDLNPSANATEVFQQVQEAYRVLSDPDMRAFYDNSRERKKRWYDLIIVFFSTAHGVRQSWHYWISVFIVALIGGGLLVWIWWPVENKVPAYDIVRSSDEYQPLRAISPPPPILPSEKNISESTVSETLNTCESQQEQVKLQNGEVLFQRAEGSHTLNVRNLTDKDALVKLRSVEGLTYVVFYIYAGQHTLLKSLPDGITLQASFATGGDFKYLCGVFASSMRTFSLARRWRLGSNDKASLNLNYEFAQAIPLSTFLDGDNLDEWVLKSP